MNFLEQEVKTEKTENQILIEKDQEILDSILQTRDEFEKIKRESRDSLKVFIDRSLFVKEELRDYIIWYFTKVFFFNAFLIIGFLIGSYYFYYKETKKDIREIKSVLKLEEKYWWDSKNRILYRSNFNIGKK